MVDGATAEFTGEQAVYMGEETVNKGQDFLGTNLPFIEIARADGFLGVRVFCSFVVEGDNHTVLDFVTLVSTLWVIYMTRFKLKSTYIAELDNMPIYYAVVPCAILAVLIHPKQPSCSNKQNSLRFLCFLGSRFSVASTLHDAECQDD